MTSVKTVSREELGQENCGPAVDCSAVAEHPNGPISSHVGISENTNFMEELICSHESALHTYKSPYETERKTGISLSSVRRIG